MVSESSSMITSGKRIPSCQAIQLLRSRSTTLSTRKNLARASASCSPGRNVRTCCPPRNTPCAVRPWTLSEVDGQVRICSRWRGVSIGSPSSQGKSSSVGRARKLARISASSGSINSVSGEVGRSILSSSHHSGYLVLGQSHCHSVIGYVTSQDRFLLCSSTDASASLAPWPQCWYISAPFYAILLACFSRSFSVVGRILKRLHDDV